MDAFLKLPPAERRLACQQVDAQMHLQAVSVEKDFWVCWALRELFALPDLGEHLTFKGGTSLSKAWGLIQRFSEDTRTGNGNSRGGGGLVQLKPNPDWVRLPLLDRKGVEAGAVWGCGAATEGRN